MFGRLLQFITTSNEDDTTTTIVMQEESNPNHHQSFTSTSAMQEDEGQSHLTELQPKQLNILVVTLSFTNTLLLLLNIIQIMKMLFGSWI